MEFTHTSDLEQWKNDNEIVCKTPVWLTRAFFLINHSTHIGAPPDSFPTIRPAGDGKHMYYDDQKVPISAGASNFQNRILDGFPKHKQAGMYQNQKLLPNVPLWFLIFCSPFPLVFSFG